MKKRLLIVLAAILFTTIVTGCSTASNGKSREEIEGLFSDFTGLFPFENYDFLYTKETNELMEEDETGIWQLSSYIQTMENDVTSIGINLSFDTKRKENYGNLSITKSIEAHEVKTEYPISYLHKKIVFVDDAVDLEVRESLEKCKSFLEIISLEERYLDSLKSTDHFYNSEASLYGINYEVKSSDKNIESINEQYPNTISNNNNFKIMLEGSGMLWEHGTNKTLRIFLDDNESSWFSATMSFVKIVDNEETAN